MAPKFGSDVDPIPVSYYFIDSKNPRSPSIGPSDLPTGYFEELSDPKFQGFTRQGVIGLYGR